MVYQIILSLIFAYISFNVAYLLTFAIAGLFKRKAVYSSVNKKRKIAVFIPTYKEDAIILETAQSAIYHDYPKDKFDVIIIADQLQESTLNSLSRLPLTLIRVSFEKSTKARSLKFALQQIADHKYDIIFILDADNIMERGCLEKVNHAFSSGHEMVQLHRTAKNRNTATAILDAISEEINNHIFRRGHRALGLSSALIGSGMAFRYADFNALMMEANIEDNPGEDREIYLRLLQQGKVCEYIEDALVYDEKVQSRAVLEKQRTRWISAQLQYANHFWINNLRKTFSYNIHYLDYAIQTLLLPRPILLVSSATMAILSIAIYIIGGNVSYPGITSWTILFGGCCASLIISIYRHITFKTIMIAMGGFPATCWSVFKALLKSRSDQKEFIHTPKEFIR